MGNEFVPRNVMNQNKNQTGIHRDKVAAANAKRAQPKIHTQEMRKTEGEEARRSSPCILPGSADRNGKQTDNNDKKTDKFAGPV